MSGRCDEPNHTRVRLADAHEIGVGSPCFVIAEAGVNHNGDVALAHRLVDAAAAAGAQAVKFQTFRADLVVSPAAPKAEYQLATTDAAESQHDMLARLELDLEAHRGLARHAADAGLVFLSTPFDLESVALLAALDLPAFKVASPDLTNYLLLDAVAACGRPVFLSTGLATVEEVEASVDRLGSAGVADVVLLHCTSEYPAPADEANVRAIPAMATRLGLPVGYSDHTEGDEVALAAVALGAVALEKHLTLDRSLPGPDHRASVEPDELARLVRSVRRVEAALGDGVKRPSASERANADLVRRSLAAARDLEAGAALGRDDLIALRPASGIPPSEVDEVVGRRLRVARRRGELLARHDLA